MLQRARHLVPFVQAKQTHAEGAEVGRLVALQRHASGRLQAQGQKLFAVLDLRVGGVADHHAGGLKARRGHAGEAVFQQQCAHRTAQCHLLFTHFGIAIGFGLEHGFLQTLQGVGGQGGVVHVGTTFVGLHHLQPLFEVHRKRGAGGAVNGFASALAQHDHGAAW